MNKKGNHYNIKEKHPFWGKHHTKKAKEKNRLAHLGKSAWNKGKKYTEE